METKQTDDVTLQTYKSAAAKKFQELQAHSLMLQENVNKLQISDSITLGLASQTIGSIKDAIKNAKAKGLEMRKPFNIANKAILEVEQSITDPLESAVEIGNLKLREWNEKEKIREQEEKSIIKKKAEYLEKVKQSVIKSIAEKAVDESSCLKLIESINVKWPSDDMFGALADESRSIKNVFIKMLQVKIENYKKGVFVSYDEEDMLEEINDHSALTEEKAISLSVASNAVTTKVRKTWKYEIINPEIMAKQFLSPDSVKINGFIKHNKENWKNDTEVNLEGIRFFLDESPMV